jgi:hypothetical protein
MLSLLLLSLCAIVKARRGESALFFVVSTSLFFSRRVSKKNARWHASQKEKTNHICTWAKEKKKHARALSLIKKLAFTFLPYARG